MEKETFNLAIENHSKTIEQIRQAAHKVHADVNQAYDKVHPYGFHLDMVADGVHEYGHSVCAEESDVLPLFFGAYFHDSIEDARQSYNDVMKIARQWLDDRQALTATEIVFALTNDKGRTRAERAGEKYYQGIRETPYAPFVKLADRLANITYSSTHDNKTNVRMKEVYRHELPAFLADITVDTDDARFALPQEMVGKIRSLVEDQ